MPAIIENLIAYLKVLALFCKRNKVHAFLKKMTTVRNMMFTIKKTALLVGTMIATTQINAQTTSIEVTDGTNATCYSSAGGAPCPSFSTTPAIDTFVQDTSGNSSEILTRSNQTTVQTTSGLNNSGLNVQSDATALESSNSTIGYAGLGTQVGTSSATGNSGGSVVGVARDTSSNFSELLLEGQVASIRTKDGTTGARSVLETSPTRAVMGHAANGVTIVQGIQATSTMTTLIGNSTANSNFTVVGSTTTNGINNQNAGITNAGLISGVTAGAVSATSTEAVNGSQLYVTNTNVTTVQSTANTALTNAATAQTTATAAQTAANNAQTTADTALTNAAAAQTTANNAQTAANNAQTTADTALTNAAAAQTTANNAQTAANNAQTTADTALANATTAQTTATAAQTTANNAATEVATFDGRLSSAEANASNALTTVGSFDNRISTAESNASAALAKVSTFDNRISNLENEVRKTNDVAKRGVAIATAIASVPPLESGKQFSVGVGLGNYSGKNAVAVALNARLSSSVTVRLNAGTTGSGKSAVGVGGAFSW